MGLPIGSRLVPWAASMMSLTPRTLLRSGRSSAYVSSKTGGHGQKLALEECSARATRTSPGKPSLLPPPKPYRSTPMDSSAPFGSIAVSASSGRTSASMCNSHQRVLPSAISGENSGSHNIFIWLLNQSEAPTSLCNCTAFAQMLSRRGPATLFVVEPR